MSEKRPLVFGVHRFALDDGPGIRTTVFFKGCPLSCLWCHNPESISAGPEISFYAESCLGCGECRKVCPEGAISLDGPARIDRSRCTACAACARACPTTALKSLGSYYPADKLVDLLMTDRLLYETSKGGVTFSGGEPGVYPEYLGEVMKELKKHKVHLAVQTSGLFDLERFQRWVLPFCDLIFYDLKLFDPDRHREHTGQGNERILRNFSELKKQTRTEIVPRIPLIPNLTARPDNIGQIAGFLKRTGCKTGQLLSYNPAGRAKRIALGKSIPDLFPETRLEREEEDRLRGFWKGIMQ